MIRIIVSGYFIVIQHEIEISLLSILTSPQNDLMENFGQSWDFQKLLCIESFTQLTTQYPTHIILSTKHVSMLMGIQSECHWENAYAWNATDFCVDGLEVELQLDSTPDQLNQQGTNLFSDI